MSRRITIETKMDNAELVEESLNELDAQFNKDGNWFRVSSAEGSKFYYNGCGVNVESGEAFYDSDDRSAKNFIQNRLHQMYTKNLVLQNAMIDGHQIDSTYTAEAGTYIEGFDDIIEAGDIIIEAQASTF